MVRITDISRCDGGHHVTVTVDTGRGTELHQFTKDELMPEIAAAETEGRRAELMALADLAVKEGAKTFEDVKAAMIARSAEAATVDAGMKT